MVGAWGPFDYITMGGMFSIVKIRDDLTSYEDPGWYTHPGGTVADVGGDYLEIVTVQMDRMMIHGAQVAEADPHSITRLSHQSLGARIAACIHRQDIEVAHLIGVGPGGPRVDPPLAQHDGEITIHAVRRTRVSGMDDNHPHQSHAHLRHLIVVGVIHEGSVLAECPFVFVRLPFANRTLI